MNRAIAWLTGHPALAAGRLRSMFGLSDAIVAGGLLALVGCTAATLAEKESPACAGLTIGATVQEDATLIAQLAVELPAGQLGPALDAFIAAKGPAQFLCAEQIAEALLGHPVAPVDAGTVPPPAPVVAKPQSALERALLMNPNLGQSALEKLQDYKAGVAR